MIASASVLAVREPESTDIALAPHTPDILLFFISSYGQIADRHCVSPRVQSNIERLIRPFVHEIYICTIFICNNIYRFEVGTEKSDLVNSERYVMAISTSDYKMLFNIK